MQPTLSGIDGATYLGHLAATFAMAKVAAKTVRGRSGRTVKSHRIAKELNAAGSPKQTQGDTFSYPRGRNV
jgi:hypothetical protein